MPTKTEEEARRLERTMKSMRAETQGYRLLEMREQYDGMSRAVVAGRNGVSETLVEQIERGDIEDLTLAVIRGYVEALGGEVEVLAKFGDERIVIA